MADSNLKPETTPSGKKEPAPGIEPAVTAA